MLTSRDLAAGGVLRRRALSLDELVAAEEARVKAGTADGCGFTCLCHGGVACVREAHPHDPEQDMGPGKPKGNVVPHVGRDSDGTWRQWVCTDPATQAMTAEDHAQVAAQARVEHTRAVLSGLDPETVRAFLAGAHG